MYPKLCPWRVEALQAMTLTSAGVNATCSILALGVSPASTQDLTSVTALQHTLPQFLPTELRGFLMVPLLTSQAKLFFTDSWLDHTFLNLDFPEPSLREVYERLWYVDGNLLLFHYWYCLFFIATISSVISLGIGEMGRLTHKGLYYHIELEHKFNFHIFHIIWLACDWFSFFQSRKKKRILFAWGH